MSKGRILKIVTLNDIIESELVELISQDLEDKELKAYLEALSDASKRLTKKADKLLKGSSEVMGEAYDVVNEHIDNVIREVFCE